MICCWYDGWVPLLMVLLLLLLYLKLCFAVDMTMVMVIDGSQSSLTWLPGPEVLGLKVEGLCGKRSGRNPTPAPPHSLFLFFFWRSAGRGPSAKPCSGFWRPTLEPSLKLLQPPQCPICSKCHSIPPKWLQASCMPVPRLRRGFCIRLQPG